MFSTRKSFALLVAAVTIGAIATSFAWAEPDPQVTEVLEKLRALDEEEGAVYMDQDIEVKVNGQTMQEMVQEVWVPDLERMRVNRTDGSVILRAPDNVIIYEGRADLGLHVPKATIDALGEKVDEALDELGLFGIEDATKPIFDSAEHMTVVGEVVVEEDECIVVDVGEEAFKHWKKRVSAGIPEGFELEALQLTLDKETGIPRIQAITMGGPATLEIIVSIWAMEFDAEMPDDLMVYSPPENAKVIVMTPDDDPMEVVDAFREEAGQRINARAQ